ncbi:MAG: hypothetical protein AB7V14_05190 [Kiritimatiellia bacterium]
MLPALLALVLFAPAVGFDFINYDDDRYVYDNPRVTGGPTVENLRWAFTAVHEDWWLPVLWISYMLDSALLGKAPGGYHLVNVLLHAANAGLLGWTLYRLTRARWRSLAVAALWAAHPLRIESVAWITERKDVLSGLFFFLALLAYVRHVERPSAVRFGLVFGAMLLGLASKASVIVLPILLLLLDFWPLRRAELPWTSGAGKPWRRLVAEKIPLFALAAVFAAINLRTHAGGTGLGLDYSWSQRVALIPGNVWTYLRLVAWPAHLSVFYPENDAVPIGSALVALAGLAGLTGWFARQARRRPHWPVGWLWFLVALLPILRGVRLGNAAYADRFTYLPSIGLTLAVVWQAMGGAERSAAARRAGAGVLALLLAACVGQTAAVLPAWRHSIGLYEYALRSEPANPVLLNNLGTALMLEQRNEEALDHFRRSLAANPAYLPARANQALVLHRLGRLAESRAAADQGLDWEQNSPPLNHMLASLLLGETPPEPRAALPDSLSPRDLGRLLERGSLPAVLEFRDLYRRPAPALLAEIRSVQLDYVRLWRSGRKDRAWRFFLFALAANPHDVSLLNDAAWLLATDSAPPADARRALLLARRAHRLAAPHLQASILDTLAAALAAAGHFDEAQRAAQEAIGLATQAGDARAADQISARLETYRNRKPWRDAP